MTNSVKCYVKHEFINGITEQQFAAGEVSIRIDSVTEEEMGCDNSITSYMIFFTNLTTGCQGVLSITEEMYQGMCSYRKGIEGNSFIINFDDDEQFEYEEDAVNEEQTIAIFINSIVELVPRYTA